MAVDLALKSEIGWIWTVATSNGCMTTCLRISGVADAGRSARLPDAVATGGGRRSGTALA